MLQEKESNALDFKYEYKIINTSRVSFKDLKIEHSGMIVNKIPGLDGLLLTGKIENKKTLPTVLNDQQQSL